MCTRIVAENNALIAAIGGVRSCVLNCVAFRLLRIAALCLLVQLWLVLPVFALAPPQAEEVLGSQTTPSYTLANWEVFSDVPPPPYYASRAALADATEDALSPHLRHQALAALRRYLPLDDAESRVELQYVLLVADGGAPSLSDAQGWCQSLQWSPPLGSSVVVEAGDSSVGHWTLAPITTSTVQQWVSEGAAAQGGIDVWLGAGAAASSMQWVWWGGRWEGVEFTLGDSPSRVCSPGDHPDIPPQLARTFFCNWDAPAPNGGSAVERYLRTVGAQQSRWDDRPSTLMTSYPKGALCYRSPCAVGLDCVQFVADGNNSIHSLPPSYVVGVTGFYPNCRCYCSGPYGARVDMSASSFLCGTATKSPPTTPTSSVVWSSTHTFSLFTSSTSGGSPTPSLSVEPSHSHSLEHSRSSTHMMVTGSAFNSFSSSLASATRSHVEALTGTAASSLSSSQSRSDSATAPFSATAAVPSLSLEEHPSRTASASVSLRRSATAPTVPLPAVEVFPLSAAQRRAEDAVAIVSVAGGMGLGPTAGQMSVAMAMVRMARCGEGAGDEEGDVAPLPLLVHPLAFGIGGGAARYERGAVVGNCLLIPFVFAVAVRFVGAHAVRLTSGLLGGAGAHPTPLSAVLLGFGWPSVLVVPFGMLGEGSAFAATSLLLRPDGEWGWGDRVLGLLGAGVLGAVVVLWAVALLRWMPPLRLEREHVDGFGWWLITAARSWRPATEIDSGTKQRRRRGGVSAADEHHGGVHVDVDADIVGVEEASSVDNSFSYSPQMEVAAQPLLEEGNGGDDAVVSAYEGASILHSTAEGNNVSNAEDASRQMGLVHCIGDRWLRGAELATFAANVGVGVLEGIPSTYAVSEVACTARVAAAAFLILLIALATLTATVPAEVVSSGVMNALLAVLAGLALASVVANGSEDGEEGASVVDEAAISIVAMAANIAGLVIMPLGMAEGLVRYALRRRRALTALMPQPTRVYDGPAMVADAYSSELAVFPSDPSPEGRDFDDEAIISTASSSLEMRGSRADVADASRSSGLPSPASDSLESPTSLPPRPLVDATTADSGARVRGQYGHLPPHWAAVLADADEVAEMGLAPSRRQENTKI